MIDYSSCVKVKDGIISRDPVPDFLTASQTPIADIADLTWLGLPDYVGYGWWPIEFHWPALGQYQSYNDDEVLSLDPGGRMVVISIRTVRDWTAQEIADWKAAQILPAAYFDYRMRLSADERAAIEIASLDAPTGAEAERLAAAKVRVFERDLALATPINLNAPWVREGLAMYEAAGLIAVGRAEIIIWGGEEP
jgi:hypothetical protein